MTRRLIIELFVAAMLGTAIGFVIWCITVYADSYAAFRGVML